MNSGGICLVLHSAANGKISQGVLTAYDVSWATVGHGRGRPRSEECIDERRDGRALGEHDDAAQQEQREHHRDHPPQLHRPQESDQLPGDRELHQETLHGAGGPPISR